MNRFFIIFFLFFQFSLSFSFVSEFLDLPVDSLEYMIVREPEKYPLKISSLVACGVKNIDEFTNIIETFERSLSERADAKDGISFARLIFEEMHKNFIKSYGLYYDNIDVLLKKGNFNCLSSTMLYSIFLEDFGYNFKAITLPTHIFTLLYIDGREIDVENTTPYGFDIRTNTEAQKIFKKLTGFDYTRETNKIEITDKKGILASLYANLSASDMRNKNYYSAFQNGIKAYSISPELRLVASNTLAAYQGYIVFLRDRKEFKKALDISYEAVRFLPEKNAFTNTYLDVLDNYLSFVVKISNEDVAMNILKEEEKRMYIPSQIRENLYINIYNKQTSGKINFDGLYNMLKKALLELPNSSNIRGLLLNSFYLFIERSDADNEKEVLKWYELMKNDADMKKLLVNYYITTAHKYYKQKELDKGIEILERGRKNIASGEIDELRKDFYLLKGIEEIEKENYEAGKDYILIAKRISPKDANVLKNLRLIYRIRVYDRIKKEDFKTAEVCLSEGLKEFPDDEKLLEYKKFLQSKKK
ncbi:MAG: tetratricopeptide repeat protein [Brevinematia bacterium]